MTWFHWLLVAIFALDGLLSIAMINEPRRPTTTSTAIFSVIVCALLIWGLAVQP